MKPKNEPTDYTLFDYGFITFDDDGKKVYNLYEGNSLRIVYNTDFQKENFDEIRLIKKDLVCPHCHARMVKNGSYKFKYNKMIFIRISGYKCCNTNHTHYVYASKLKDVDKFCSFDREIRKLGVKLSLIDFLSYDKLSELLEALTGVNVNRETMFYFTDDSIDEILEEIQKEQELEITKLNIKPSGHYGYDEQYIFINGELFMRMTIIDNENNLIINNELIHKDDFNQNTIQDFMERSLKNLEVKSITTDGNNSYPNIIDALGAIHHRCVFHIMKNLMDDIKKDIRRLEKRIDTINSTKDNNKAKLKELDKLDKGKKGKPSKEDKEWKKHIKEKKKLRSENSKLTTERSNKRKELRQFITFKRRVSLIFKSKKEKTAINRYNKLLNDKRIPMKIKKFLEKIEDILPNLINHIEDDDIPSTNNKVEGFYKITLPKCKKRIYRTIKGIKRRMLLSQLRWTHRQVLGHTGPLIKINLLTF